MRIPRRRFRSPVHLAEVATSGVRFNLAVGDGIAAAALQLVAHAAWAMVDDPAETGGLSHALDAAEEHLRMTCGMSGERRFLRDVRDFLTGPDDASFLLAGGDGTDDAPVFPEPPDPVSTRADLPAAQHLAAVAGEYMRAAAALSEASVLMLTACTAAAAHDADPFDDGALTRVPALLEGAAASHRRLVDLIAHGEDAHPPDTAFHLDELRIGARALLEEAALLAPTDGNPDAGESTGDDAFTIHDLVDLLSDRAETFRASARFLAACGEIASRKAWTLGSA